MVDRTPTAKASEKWCLVPLPSRFEGNPSRSIGYIRQLEFCVHRSSLHPFNPTRQHHLPLRTRIRRRATLTLRRTTARTSSATSADPSPSQIPLTRFRLATALKTFPRERIRSTFQLPCRSTMTTSSSSHRAWARAAQVTTVLIHGNNDTHRLVLVSLRFTATLKTRVVK